MPAVRWRRGGSSTTKGRANRPVNLAIAASALLLIWYWSDRITETAIDGDARGTVIMALNLVEAGTMSEDGAPRFSPSMYREPVPVLTTAAAIVVANVLFGPVDRAAHLEGSRARFLKYQNVVWMLVLCSGLFGVLYFFTRSPWVALAGVWLANAPLPLLPAGLEAAGIDTLYSDLPAAAVLVVSSGALAVGTARRRLLPIAGAGFGLATLALIKAAFFHVFLGFAAIATIHGVLMRWKQGDGTYLKQVVVMTLCFVSVVSIWMYRNYRSLDAFAIAERGGIVLLLRATKNLMTWDEYRGSFYAWAPEELRSPVGALLGYGPADLQSGGRLQRLNRGASDFAEVDMAAERDARPDLAMTYYRQARAEREKLEREMGAPANTNEVDKVLEKRAAQSIVDHPGRHLALTVPLLWRGAPVVFPILLVALIQAARRRDRALAAFVLPSFGLVMFCALLSHFIPRYSVPVMPVGLVVLLVLLAGLFGKTRAGLNGAAAGTTAA